MKLSEKGNRKQYSQSKFKEGIRTCPVCGNTNDWDCNFTEDGTLVYCRFTPNESGITDTLGKYKHIFKDDRKSNFVSTKPNIDENVTEAVKADAIILDRVYSAFLEQLQLNPIHRRNLVEERGLSIEQVLRNGYVSDPAYKRTEIVYNLSKLIDLEGVPGFYLDCKIWSLNINCSGFYVPYRDEKGRIVGLQLRRDEDVENKYMWVSSSGKEKGVSSGSPLHFVNPNIVKESKVVFLTEGALKADIIGSVSDVGLVASAGVGAINPDKLLNSIFEVFPDLEKIVVAYDMDWETNENVRLALVRLLDALEGRSVEVDVTIWNFELGKGIDDVLVNENYEEGDIKFIPAEEFRDLLPAVTPENVEEIVAEQTETTFVIEEPVIEDDEPTEQDTEFEEKAMPDKNVDTFGITCRDFLEMDIPTPDRVVWGLGRGNVGLMVASTNIGKTTLALNLSLSAGMDKTFLPLFDENHKGRRVMYIDGEATKGELQADIRKMFESCSTEEQELIKDNLCFVCDEELNDEPLDLVNPEHLQIVTEKAVEFKPDLIIVDTLSALTLMEDENDNAKVTREIIQPLKKLGRKANAGVLLLHHTGKYIEGSPQAEDSYKGRGASALGALSRVVYNLKKISGSENRVTLSCSKDKVGKFEPVVMELDANTRWFSVVSGVSAKTSTKAEQDYWKLVDYVKNENRRVKRKEIVDKFTANEEFSVTKIGKILKKAVKAGDLGNKYGFYFSPELKANPNKEDIQYCRISTAVATKNNIYINPNQELAVKE